LAHSTKKWFYDVRKSLKLYKFGLFRPRGHDGDHGACHPVTFAPDLIQFRWIWTHVWKCVVFADVGQNKNMQTKTQHLQYPCTTYPFTCSITTNNTTTGIARHISPLRKGKHKIWKMRKLTSNISFCCLNNQKNETLKIPKIHKNATRHKKQYTENLRNNYGKYTEHIWNTYGKYTEQIRKRYGTNSNNKPCNIQTHIHNYRKEKNTKHIQFIISNTEIFLKIEENMLTQIPNNKENYKHTTTNKHILNVKRTYLKNWKNTMSWIYHVLCISQTYFPFIRIH
jgi:hypothetical protein